MKNSHHPEKQIWQEFKNTHLTEGGRGMMEKKNQLLHTYF